MNTNTHNDNLDYGDISYIYILLDERRYLHLPSSILPGEFFPITCGSSHVGISRKQYTSIKIPRIGFMLSAGLMMMQLPMPTKD